MSCCIRLFAFGLLLVVRFGFNSGRMTSPCFRAGLIWPQQDIWTRARVQSALRETGEEIGIDLQEQDLHSIGGIPFPFRRPDGKLDNEFANVYLYAPERVPSFQVSDEVAGLGSMRLSDYDKLIRTGQSVTMNLYECRLDGQRPVRVGIRTCGPDDFCCLNMDEWKGVQKGLSDCGKGVDKSHSVADLPDFGSSQADMSGEFSRV